MKVSRWMLVGALAAMGCSSEVSPSAPDPAGGGGAGGDMPAVPRVVFVDRDGAEIGEQRYGEPFAVRAEGIAADEVTLRSRLWGYEGWAIYALGDDGVVDTRDDAPADGSYDGVHGEGLLWSMDLLGPEQSNDFDVIVVAEVDGVVIADARLIRHPLDRDLQIEDIDVDGLKGQLFKPASAEGALPGVLILGGSEGGIPSFTAAYLAGYGYVALALGYFGVAGLPSDLEHVDVGYLEQGMRHLAMRDDVDDQRLAVFGGSRGSEAALMLAARDPSIDAVIAQVPSHVRWASVYDPTIAAWDEDGTPLPYMPSVAVDLVPELLPDGSSGYRTTPQFIAAFDAATPAELDAAGIAAEQSQAAILLMAGEDDGVWPSCLMAQMLMDRLDAAGHSAAHGDEAICFPDAGHVGIMPGWPTTDSYASKLGLYTFINGGSPRGNHDAQRQGLERALAFLNDKLD